MVKSYKMLVLLAMIDADRFSGSISVDDLARSACGPRGSTRLTTPRAVVEGREDSESASAAPRRGSGRPEFIEGRSAASGGGAP
jgi:hypothetical protein